MRDKIIGYVACFVVFFFVFFVVKIAANVVNEDFYELLTTVTLWMLIRVGYNLMMKIDA